MNIQTLLEQKGITKYRLSKISGVPKTTILDICSGKTSIENCNAKTVYLIAQALDCSMEELMLFDKATDYDRNTGLPIDESYLECGLPQDLQASIEAMKKSWAIVDSGKRDIQWDIVWCDLNADINSAEVDGRITSEQANYLRKKHLRM